VPRRTPVDESSAPTCATAVAAEALRTGIVPLRGPLVRGREEIVQESETIRAGDPDDRPMANEYVGEETPGGSTQTPDQNDVDAIGRVYGVQEEDSGSLRLSSEILARRDRHRPELTPPGRRY
jgi:hypothetical protein